MSDNKTEQPTEKRKREAREQGQVARSRALSATASGALGLMVALGTVSGSGGDFVRYTRGALEQALESGQAPSQAMALALHMLLSLAAPALAAAMLGALVATAAQVGLQFNVMNAAPKLERLDPSQAFKRMFGLEGLIEVARSLLAVLVVAAIAWSTLHDNANLLGNLAQVDGVAGTLAGLALTREIVKKSAFVLLALGAADFMYQRYQHQQSLMMTKEEVKQEHKNSEGDPHIKHKRKRFARELLNAAGKGVKGSTAVVVNPTHVAVALLYDEKVSEAPVITARGTEEEALRIRLEARRSGVPIVKDIPLARALVKFDVGEEVPEELYQAVAGVMKVVFEQNAEAPEEKAS